MPLKIFLLTGIPEPREGFAESAHPTSFTKARDSQLTAINKKETRKRHFLGRGASFFNGSGDLSKISITSGRLATSRQVRHLDAIKGLRVSGKVLDIKLHENRSWGKGRSWFFFLYVVNIRATSVR